MGNRQEKADERESGKALCSSRLVLVAQEWARQRAIDSQHAHLQAALEGCARRPASSHQVLPNLFLYGVDVCDQSGDSGSCKGLAPIDRDKRCSPDGHFL